MIILADPQRTFLDQVVQRLGSQNGIVRTERFGELDRFVREHGDQVEVAVIGPNFDADLAMDEAIRLRGSADIGVVLIAKEATPELLHRALRAGLHDVLELPFASEDLQAAVQRAREYVQQRRGRTQDVAVEPSSDHRVITVFSTKGGCGKSVVASNLAVLLARQSGEDVALVDLDLQSGDLAIMLQLLPAWTLYDAAENVDRLDAEAVRGYMTEHRSGVKLLAAPVDPAHADAVTPKAVHRILGLLRDEYPYVVVDTPPMFTDQVLAALDENDECVLVTSMDVPSIKNLKLALQTLEKLGLERDRLQLLLNRADSNVGLRLHEVEKSIGTHVDVALPSSRDVPLSVNQGVPLALERRKSPIVEPLTKLADRIHANRVDDPATTGGRLRGLLRRG